MIHIEWNDSLTDEFTTLNDALHQSYGARFPETEAKYAAHNGVDGVSNFMTVFDEDKPVGICCFADYGNGAAELKRLFVLPEYRRQGIASYMLEEAENMMALAGFERAVLDTVADNLEAIALYENNHYARVENFAEFANDPTIACFEKPLESFWFGFAQEEESDLQGTYTLTNDLEIPRIGFGTWQLPDERAKEVVSLAISLGYRHIDTAAAYGNEKGVGEGVIASGTPVSEIFITTKIPAEVKTYEGAKASIENSVKLLGKVDLILIHAPKPWEEMHGGGTEPHYEENVAVWRAMEEAYEAGKVGAIGVSNFSIDDLNNILSNCKIRPMVNQIKAYIGNFPTELVEFCEQNDILTEAYSPIATGRLTKEGVVVEMAKKYGVTPSQICIKYLLQKGMVPLPKSTHEEYMKMNAETDFVISDSDMGALDAIPPITCKLCDLKNMTPEIETKLRSVGINAYEQLNSTGAKTAALMIGATDEETLFALEGAIRGVAVTDLSDEVKEGLRK